METSIAIKALTLGAVVATPAVLAVVRAKAVHAALERHRHGDWGDVSPVSRAANDDAARSGEERVISVYSDGDTIFWIITEWDRSVTTVLLPDDY